jgi:aquaporin Z
MRRALATSHGRALYRQRQISIEPVFGQIKFNRVIRPFQRRGRAACRSEWRFIAATHNLLKLYHHRLASIAASDSLPSIAALESRRRFQCSTADAKRAYCSGIADAGKQPGPPVDSIEMQERRASHRLLLEFGSREEWDDPALEFRRLFAELFGTFLLVLVAAGGGLLHAKGQISLAAAVVSPGLMVMAIILFMGAVSGAHLNPGVSLAFAMRRDFAWQRAPGYILAQLIGATLASLFLLAVFGNVGHLGATVPGAGYADWQALLMETALTVGLVSVVLGTASAAQNVGAIAAVGVGGYIALAGLWAAPVSGASMNPARSFGPALVGGDFASFWIYVVGPLAAVPIAVAFAYILRGRGGDPISRAAGSGVLSRASHRAHARLAEDIAQARIKPPGIANSEKRDEE